MKKWLTSFFFDSIVFTLLYLWLFEGIDGAGNVVRPLLWFVAVLAWIGVFAMDDAQYLKASSSKIYSAYSVLGDVATFALLAWFGYPVLGTVYVTGALFLFGKKVAVQEKAASQAVK